MKTLHAIVSQFAKDETRVGITRRDLKKIKDELRRSAPTHHVSTERMMAHPRHHEGKMYWPVRDTTFVLQESKRVRDERHTEHPLITARRQQFPKTR